MHGKLYPNLCSKLLSNNKNHEGLIFVRNFSWQLGISRNFWEFLGISGTKTEFQNGIFKEYLRISGISRNFRIKNGISGNSI
jgi:hypothetical protein